MNFSIRTFRFRQPNEIIVEILISKLKFLGQNFQMRILKIKFKYLNAQGRTLKLATPNAHTDTDLQIRTFKLKYSRIGKIYLLLGVNQIDFIANDDDGHGAFGVKNLGSERLHFEERVSIVNVVHEDKRVRGFDG